MSALPDRSRRRVRQIDIPTAQLETGVYGPHNTLVPWGAIATLQLGARDLGQRSGIHFAESYDQLDSLWIALLELPSRRHVALVEHLHAPVAGIEVHAAAQEASAAEELLAETMQELALRETDVVWRRFG